jgi:large subunit ribosomal protein L3
LQAARVRHLELKEARRQKRIAELMEQGMKPTEEQADAIEQIIAASARKESAEQTPANF